MAETGQPYAFTGDDPLNATDPLGLAPGLNPRLWTARNLPNVRNYKLRNILRSLYRAEDEVRGGTAGALREEAETGKPVGGRFHDVKGVSSENGLEDLIESDQLATRQDRLVARATLADLAEAQDQWDTAAAGGKFDDAASSNVGGITEERVAAATERFQSEVVSTALGDNPADPGFTIDPVGSADGSAVGGDELPVPPDIP